MTNQYEQDPDLQGDQEAIERSEKETINFTPALRDSLRESYDHAVDKKSDTFQWHGKEFVTNYAKYLLEHLDNQFRGAA